MADSSATANLGSGGVAFDGDLIGGEFIPFTKIVFGALGTRTLVEATAGLPVHQQTGATWAVSLAAGTNAIGKLAANDGVDVGDVTVNNAAAAGVYVRPGDGATFAVSLATVPSHAVTNAGVFAVQIDGAALTALQLIDNLVLAEDAVHSNGDPGVQVLAVRADSLAAKAGSDGDYSPLQVNASGALYVAVSGAVTVSAHAVTNAGVFAVQVDGDALTALQLIDDSVHAEDAAHVGGDKGLMLLAVRNDTPGALATTDGDYIPLTTDSSGRLYTLAAQTGTWNVGTVTAVTGITNPVAVTGTFWQATQPVSGTFWQATQPISAAALPLPTGAAAETTLGDCKTALQILDNCISGNEAQCDVITQPARARTTDTVSASVATDAIMSGTTALTPKFAVISGATSGNNTLVAAVADKKVRVLSLYLVSAGTTTVRFESGADGTALSGVMSLIANTGFVLPFNPAGHFETAVNTLLNMELNAAIQVSGGLTYVEVP